MRKSKASSNEMALFLLSIYQYYKAYANKRRAPVDLCVNL